MKQLINSILAFLILAGCSDNSNNSSPNKKAKLSYGSAMVKEQDVIDIINQFTEYTTEDQNLLLQDVYPKNKKLAETLLIYRQRLYEAANNPQLLKQTIKKTLLHYVINTDGPLPIMKDSVSIIESIKNYGQPLGFNVDDATQEAIPTLTLDDRTEACTNCTGKDYEAIRNSGIEINKMRYGRPDVIPSTAFNFNAKQTTYSLENAMTVADFSNLAYFDEPFVTKQLQLWGYTFIGWLQNKKTDTQGFIAGKNDYQIICFRGTNSITDMVYDAWFTKTAAYGGTGKVHKGFNNALQSVWPQLIKIINKNTPLFITGHSLGGALAILTAHRLAVENYSVAGVYTFGAPRVGNWAFKNAYDNLLKAKTFLHINHTDIVPTVAPEILGFAHPGNIRTFNKDHVITTSSTTQEVEEKNFNELDMEERQEIEGKIKRANKTIKATTNYMRTSPNSLNAFSYSAEFENGKLDNHGVDQYLFKLACAIIDREWLGVSNQNPVH
jgi:triacylglycerol lipase